MRRLSNNFLRHDLIIDFNLNFDSYLRLARGWHKVSLLSFVDVFRISYYYQLLNLLPHIEQHLSLDSIYYVSNWQKNYSYRMI